MLCISPRRNPARPDWFVLPGSGQWHVDLRSFQRHRRSVDKFAIASVKVAPSGRAARKTAAPAAESASAWRGSLPHFSDRTPGETDGPAACGGANQTCALADQSLACGTESAIVRARGWVAQLAEQRTENLFHAYRADIYLWPIDERSRPKASIRDADNANRLSMRVPPRDFLILDIRRDDFAGLGEVEEFPEYRHARPRNCPRSRVWLLRTFELMPVPDVVTPARRATTSGKRR